MKILHELININIFSVGIISKYVCVASFFSMEHNGKRCSCERKKYFSTNSAINFLSKLKYNTYDDFELISFKKK